MELDYSMDMTQAVSQEHEYIRLYVYVRQVLRIIRPTHAVSELYIGYN